MTHGHKLNGVIKMRLATAKIKKLEEGIDAKIKKLRVLIDSYQDEKVKLAFMLQADDTPMKNKQINAHVDNLLKDMNIQ